MNYAETIKKLKLLKNQKNIDGMARFGINPKYALGINIPVLRELAKDIKHTLQGPTLQSMEKKHNLAHKLWNSKIHEARILAGMIDVPEMVTEKQMDTWIKDFNSWDLCDQTCMNLFWQHPSAYKKATKWANLSPTAKALGEYQKRTGFSLMAVLAWHDKKASEKKFTEFFPLIKREAIDERNYVKKAVNWSLRNIGKRNKNLNIEATKLAKEIDKIDNKTAHWIAKDALRELTSEKIQVRLK